MSGLFLLLSCFVEISELNVNSVDYDQTASDLGYNVCQCIFYGTQGSNELKFLEKRIHKRTKLGDSAA